MSELPVEAMPAATVLLLRDLDGLEVLMVERVARGFFGGLMVFPGGGVDACDRSPAAVAAVTGTADDQVFRAAGLRELAEETSIGLAPEGAFVSPQARGEDLYRALVDTNRRLDGAGLALVSRWVTPTYAPRRYDTRFYVAWVDGDPEVRVDERELVTATWVRPPRALALAESGDWRMFTPTVAHLRWLARHDTVASAVGSAAGADGRTPDGPTTIEDGSIVHIKAPEGGH